MALQFFTTMLGCLSCLPRLESRLDPLQGKHEVFGRLRTRWHCYSGGHDSVGETRISNPVVIAAEDGRAQDPMASTRMMGIWFDMRDAIDVTDESKKVVH